MCKWFLYVGMIAALATPAGAVVLYETPNRLTKAPTGSLAGSGWQWEGQWEGFLGTAISKNTFITAGHIGGHVGDYFKINGINYKTVATFNDPQTDLQIWSIHGQFTSAAPLYKKTNETGHGAVLFGRGTQRGAPIVVNNQLKGWLWGQNDGVQSWGKNIFTGTAAGTSDASAGSKKVNGSLLAFAFDANAWAHEGTITGGDSGGGIFTKDGTTWELAGVNFSAESSFSIPGSGLVQSGAIFDAGGLQFGNDVITDTATDIPTHAYATRISTRMSWISSVLAGKVAPSATLASASIAQGVPEPMMLTPLLLAAMLLRRRIVH